jgi:hypothetical protein
VIKGVQGGNSQRLAEAARPGAEDDLALPAQTWEIAGLVHIEHALPANLFKNLLPDGQPGQILGHLIPLPQLPANWAFTSATLNEVSLEALIYRGSAPNPVGGA